MARPESFTLEDVYLLVKEGKAPKEIADALGVNVRSVRYKINKAGYRNLGHLAATWKGKR